MSEWYRLKSADPITRRQWLLRLGETVALAGVSGLVPEALAEPRAVEEVKPTDPTDLPPGLYLPSPDHLAHALENARKSYIVFPDSETEYARPTAGPYQPQFFSRQEFQIVTRFVEIVLGNMTPVALSQTTQWIDLWLQSAAGALEAAQHLDPLHRALAVAYYGEASVQEVEASNPQLVAREGMAALHQVSTAQYGMGFLEVTQSEQIKLVSWMRETEKGNALHKFFDLIRNEGIRGYYTSAEGLKELDYRGNVFHGQCPGCAAY